MVTRILFVDDETLVLQGLRRMLQPMRGEWEMTFASSAESALQAMSVDPFDVIVSDMRMPGMDGADLLSEVMRRQPQTVRIVLSGQSDHETVLRSIGKTHRFLAKPCDPEVLKAAVRRACELRDGLQMPFLEGLVAGLDSLPSMPDAYNGLEAELRSPDTSLDRLSAIVADDPAMSAKVLQLVSSAFFGPTQAPPTAAGAVARLGIETMRSLAAAVGTFSAFDERRDVELLEDFWRHSMTVARYAHAVAGEERRHGLGVSPALAEQAQTAGLLHDIGLLLLITQLPDEYNAVLDRAKRDRVAVWEAEQQDLGATHAAVGAYLLGTWGLPDAVVDAVCFHHTPNDCADIWFSPLTAIHIADAFDHEAALSRHATAQDATVVNHRYVERLGLTHRLPAWRAACAM